MNPRSAWQWAGFALLGLLVIAVFLPLLISPTHLGAFFTVLPFGWLGFLMRNVPQISYNWSTISTGIIVSVLALVVGNFLLTSIHRQVQQTLRPRQPVRRWRWIWTLSIYAAVWLLFLIAFGVGGIWRGTNLVMADHRPWYQERRRPMFELRMASGALDQLVLDNHRDLEATRSAYLRQSSPLRPDSRLFEEFNVILFPDRDNRVAAYILVPRDAKLADAGLFGVSVADKFDPEALPDLRQTIAELEARFPRGR